MAGTVATEVSARAGGVGEGGAGEGAAREGGAKEGGAAQGLGEVWALAAGWGWVASVKAMVMAAACDNRTDPKGPLGGSSTQQQHRY